MDDLARRGAAAGRPPTRRRRPLRAEDAEKSSKISAPNQRIIGTTAQITDRRREWAATPLSHSELNEYHYLLLLLMN